MLTMVNMVNMVNNLINMFRLHDQYDQTITLNNSQCSINSCTYELKHYAVFWTRTDRALGLAGEAFLSFLLRYLGLGFVGGEFFDS